MEKATEVLSSAPQSILDFRMLESLELYVQRSVDSFVYYHMGPEVSPPATISGYKRDPLGRTAAHLWLDAMKSDFGDNSLLEDLERMIDPEDDDLHD
jgi:hypothetical protein